MALSPCSAKMRDSKRDEGNHRFIFLLPRGGPETLHRVQMGRDGDFQVSLGTGRSTKMAWKLWSCRISVLVLLEGQGLVVTGEN